MYSIDKRRTANTIGCLSKAWYTDDTGAYLVKGNSRSGKGFCGWEPYSEAIATIVAEVLGIPHIAYTTAPAVNFPEVAVFDIPVVSVCRMCNVPKGSQKISALTYIEASMGKPIVDDIWQPFRRLPVDMKGTFDMLVFDAIIGNVDRHLNNWEYVLNPDNTVTLAPIYDFGNSLLATESRIKSCLDRELGPDKAKPFKETHLQQLRLIKRCYSDYRFVCDIDTCWRKISKGIQPILFVMPNRFRAQTVYEYLHKRFYFYLNMVS